MASEQTSKVNLNNLSEGIEIQITKKMDILPVLFLGCWSAAWAVGEFSVLEILLDKPFALSKLPLYIWFAIWSVVGFYVIILWLWHLNGKEFIRIDEQNLNHQRSFTVFSRSQNYAVNNISKLSVGTKNSSMFKLNSGIRYWGLSGGLVEFNYGHHSYRFGSDLSKAQANSIVEQIKARYVNL